MDNFPVREKKKKKGKRKYKEISAEKMLAN